MLRDRRGVGVAEYALMLFLVIVVAAVVFRYMGKSVKHAGNKTEEQFATNAGGANSAGGASSGGGGQTTAAGGGGGGSGKGGGGTGGAAGGGGGGGGGAAGANAQSNNSSGGTGVDQLEEAESSGTPLWKIIGGVFILLFAIGGYFAFRKQSKGG